jgi:Rha family phage regulatory protein
MIAHQNECVAAALQEIESAGYAPVVEPRGKHLAIVWRQGSTERQYFAPSTPSDRRAWLNCRADIRRMLREGQDSSGEVVAISAPRLITTDDVALASSKDVAKAFDKRHDHVLRDIDNLLKNIDSPNLGSAMFRPSVELDANGIGRRVYHIDRDGFALLAMGFSGPKAISFKLAYLEAFKAMERALSRERERTASLTARDDLLSIRADLTALTELVLDAGTPNQKPARRTPFVRPSVLRRHRAERRV